MVYHSLQDEKVKTCDNGGQQYKKYRIIFS